MPGLYTEADYENSVIELFRNDLGYEYAYGPDIERDFYSPLYEEVLLDSLYRLNRGLPDDAIQDALFKLKNFENGELVQKNAVFMDYLQNGIPVRYFVDGEERSSIVYLVDYKNPDKNSFIVANQWTFIENSNKRPDVILFLNGLPVVLVELKSPSREETDASEAYRQLRNYMKEIPSMFIYNAICVMSDQLTSKAGTITSGEDRFMEWKTKDGDYENTQYAQFDTFFEGMFQKARLLDIIKNFICFSNEGINSFKILAGYHQYFAVRKAIESTKHATVTDGKGGVFWHTQGSGKSLSMVFYAHLLQEALDSPTIVVITDRNDLDDQLYGQFAKCKDFLRQEPMHAESRENLKSLLAGRQANGIIFTTMQKFEESHEALSERHNIVVMADEAHRGQYGLTETVDAKTGKVKIGTARVIRNTLPNATYIGFTGTPISSKDRSTREVFGDYIDIYDMTQAVEDGATRPVYYESRVIKLNLDEATLRLIDTEYDIMSANADEEVIEKSKRELGQMEAILGNDNTINSLVTETNMLREAISNAKTFGKDYMAMTEAQQYELGSYVNLMLSSTQLLVNPIMGLLPKFDECEFDKYMAWADRKAEKTMCNDYKPLIISLCNLLYKIGLDDKDKKLLFKTFRKNKKMLAAMNIKKKEFSTDIMDAVEEALSYNYELQSLNAKR